MKTRSQTVDKNDLINLREIRNYLYLKILIPS